MAAMYEDNGQTTITVLTDRIPVFPAARCYKMDEALKAKPVDPPYPYMFVACDYNISGGKYFQWVPVWFFQQSFQGVRYTQPDHFYEVVFGTHPCRLFFDVDIKDVGYATPSEYEELIVDVVMETWEALLPNYPVQRSDFKTLTSYDPDQVDAVMDKISFHLIGPDLLFEEVLLMRPFLTRIEESVLMKSKYELLRTKGGTTVFDPAVYRKRGCFRLPHMRKFGSPRRLFLSARSKEHAASWGLLTVHDYLNEGRCDIQHYIVAGTRMTVARLRGVADPQQDCFAKPLITVRPADACTTECNCRYSTTSRMVSEFHEANPNDLLRLIPINRISHGEMLKLLVATRRALVSTEDIVSLFEFRYRHRVDVEQKVRAMFQAWESIDIHANDASVDHLVTLLFDWGCRDLQMDPDLFAKAIPEQMTVDRYELETGRARAIKLEDGITQIKRGVLSRSQRAYLSISPMGSGKTYQQLEFIKGALAKYPDAHVIILTVRQLMAKDIRRRYVSVLPYIQNYLDVKARCKTHKQVVREMNMCQHLIIQLESLHLIDTNPPPAGPRRKNLIMVIDEAESVFSQFVSETMSGHFLTVFQTFRNLINQSASVLFAEALPSMRTYEMVKILCPLVQVEINQAIRLQGAEPRKSIHFPVYYTLMGHLQKLVGEGKRIGIFSATKKMAMQIEALLTASTPSLRCYHSGDRSTHADFDDIHGNWRTAQVVIWTSVVTVGISYDEVGFDYMAAFVNAQGPMVRDMIQAVHRIRNLTSNTLLWSGKGPFAYVKKKSKAPAQNDMEEDAEEEEEEAPAEEDICEEKLEQLTYFETIEVMDAVWEEKQRRVDRQYAGQLGCREALLGRLAYYSMFEQSLQKTRHGAERLFAYFLRTIGYVDTPMSDEPILPNVETPEVDIQPSLRRFRPLPWHFPDEVELAEDLPLLMYDAPWQDPDEVDAPWQDPDEVDEKKEDKEEEEDPLPTEPTNLLHVQTYQDNRNDLLVSDTPTIKYRNELRKYAMFLQFLARNPMILHDNEEFMENMWKDFKDPSRRTWSRFPFVLWQDYNRETAMEKLKFYEMHRTQKEKGVANAKGALQLKARFAILDMFQMKHSYSTPAVLDDNALKAHGAQVLSLYNEVYHKSMAIAQPKQIRFCLDRLLKDLRIGIELQSDSERHTDNSRTYKTTIAVTCPLSRDWLTDDVVEQLLLTAKSRDEVDACLDPVESKKTKTRKPAPAAAAPSPSAQTLAALASTTTVPLFLPPPVVNTVPATSEDSFEL